MHPKDYKLRLLADVFSRTFCLIGEEDGDPEPGAGGGDEDPGGAEGGEDSAGEADPKGGEEDPAGGAEADPEPAPAPKRTPWQVKRIDKLSGELKAEREAREAAEAAAEENRRRVAAYEALYGKEGDPKPEAKVPLVEPGGKKTYTQEEMDAEVQRRSNLTALNERLDNLYETGKKAHPDFEERVSNAGRAFPELGRRVDLFQAIAKLPNGTDVYHALAGDLDQMGEVLDMSPLDLGMELARMSTELKAKNKGPPVSRAPAPIDPVTGRGAGAGKLDPMTDHAKDFEARQAKRRERLGY